jgi:hypothetical protein
MFQDLTPGLCVLVLPEGKRLYIVHNGTLNGLTDNILSFCFRVV